MGFKKSINKKIVCAVACLAACVLISWSIGFSLRKKDGISENSSDRYTEANNNSSNNRSSGDSEKGDGSGVYDSATSGFDGGDSSGESSKDEEHKHDFYEAYRKSPECESDGFIVYKCVCGHEKRETVPSKGHSFGLSDGDYITVAKCRDCDKTAKNACSSGEALLKSKIDFGFSADLEEVYGALTQKLNEAAAPDFCFSDEFSGEFTEKYGEFISLAVKSRETFLNAYALASCDGSAAEIYDKAQKIYDDYSFKGINLLSEIKNSVLSEYFYSEENGWIDRGIKSLSELLAVYAEKGDEYRALLSEKSKIDDQIKTVGENSDLIDELYFRRSVCDKKIALLFGFDGEADFGYGEYANKFLYRREYKPDKTTKVKRYAKKYLIPHLKTIAEKATELNFSDKNSAAYSVFNDSVLDSCRASEIVSGYLKALQKTSGGKNSYYEINSAFKNGRILSGKGAGSFTLKTDAGGGGIIYLGKSDANAFSFAHECGHYFCGENCVDFLPADTAETAAMLNESLFLAYLTGESSPLSQTEKEYAENRKLFELAVISLAALAIDDFEQSVYSDYYNSDDFNGGINYADYGLLFNLILKEYGISDYVSPNYRKTAAFGDSFNYFSYAMAALSALEFYYKAKECGFSQAAENYFAFLSVIKKPAATESGVNLCARYFENCFCSYFGSAEGGAGGDVGGSGDFISLKSALLKAGAGYPFEEKFYAIFGRNG